jgi:hypothetical protein
MKDVFKINYLKETKHHKALWWKDSVDKVIPEA